MVASGDVFHDSISVSILITLIFLVISRKNEEGMKIKVYSGRRVDYMYENKRDKANPLLLPKPLYIIYRNRDTRPDHGQS